MKTQEQRSRFAVSYPTGGAFLVASLVGQYIIEKYGAKGKSSIETAFTGNEYGFHPLVPTHLGMDGMDHDTDVNILWRLDPEQCIKIVRDPLDCFAVCYLSDLKRHPELTFEDFIDGPAGLVTYRIFEDNIRDVNWGEIISYENLIANPESVISRILHRCVGELNSDGVDLSVVDVIIEKSQIKNLRESENMGYDDSVGISKSVFTEEQIESILTHLN
jgi:hypothetical protein